MMIKSVHSMLVLITALVFFSFSTSVESMVQYPNPSIISRKTTAEAASILAKKYDLEAVGFGSAINDTIEELSLSCYRKMNIDEYRKLAVQCAEDYLDIINSDKELKQYLHHHPFITNDIDLIIFLFNNDREQFEVGKICCISIHKGKLCYSKRNSKYTEETAWEESFEDAKRLVYEKQNSRKTL